MKTFKQFLNEGDSFDLEQFKTDCQFMLNIMSKSDQPNKEILYHGSGTRVFDYRIMQWKEREGPRDTPQRIHNAVNDYFKERLGHPIRNWLFTTGNKKYAAQYGRGVALAIFPIGEFQWVYSPAVKDLTVILQGFKDSTAENTDLSAHEVDERSQNSLIDHIQDSTWVMNRQLDRGIARNVEIMIKCNEFYAVNADSKLFTTVIEPFLQTL